MNNNNINIILGITHQERWEKRKIKGTLQGGLFDKKAGKKFSSLFSFRAASCFSHRLPTPLGPGPNGPYPAIFVFLHISNTFFLRPPLSL